MRTFATVPVKDLDKAKSRLAGCLNTDERKKLLLAMLTDVLKAASAMPTVVICPEDISAHLQGFENVLFLLQRGGRDLNSAVVQANSYAVEMGAEATFFVPADMPLIRAGEIEKVLALGRDTPVVITQARDGGTGILFRHPPDVMESRFTGDSFTDHQREAQKKGIKMQVHKSFPLSLDIDTIDDLQIFMKHGAGTKTFEYLKTLNLWS
jgi:2-phospho-L-lactate/phosphoenolpyruvate guanylyltransferase